MVVRPTPLRQYTALISSVGDQVHKMNGLRPELASLCTVYSESLSSLQASVVLPDPSAIF